MAYLKSSQITGLSAKDVDVKGFTQATSLKLGDRAYTEHEVLLADNYNIVGDVTVSENLILSKLSDDGDAITLTGDTTTRTISGSGSIEGATLAQTPNASMTGMTGELGSAVTGGAGLTALGTVASGTLGSGVTFPAGHVTKVTHYPITTNQTITGGTYTSYQVITYSPSNPLSKLYVHHIVNFTMGTGGSARHMWHMSAAGDDITNRTDSSSNYHVLSNVGSSFLFYRAQQFPSIELDGTGTADVTLTFEIQHESAYSNLETAIKGNSDGCMTNTIVTEVY